MKVDVYKAIGSKIKPKTWFIIIKADSNLTEIVPKDTLNNAANFIRSQTFELKPNDHRIALDSKEAINDINDKGFHLQGININVSFG